jgi:hypothetical protein
VNNKKPSHQSEPNFEARFDCVVKHLRADKSICKSLFDNRWVHRLAWSPDAEEQRKESNRNINKMRDVQVHIAHDAIGRGVYERNDNGDIVHVDDHQVVLQNAGDRITRNRGQDAEGKDSQKASNSRKAKDSQKGNPIKGQRQQTQLQPRRLNNQKVSKSVVSKPQAPLAAVRRSSRATRAPNYAEQLKSEESDGEPRDPVVQGMVADTLETEAKRTQQVGTQQNEDVLMGDQEVFDGPVAQKPDTADFSAGPLQFTAPWGPLAPAINQIGQDDLLLNHTSFAGQTYGDSRDFTQGLPSQQQQSAMNQQPALDLASFTDLINQPQSEFSTLSASIPSTVHMADLLPAPAVAVSG